MLRRDILAKRRWENLIDLLALGSRLLPFLATAVGLVTIVAATAAAISLAITGDIGLVIRALFGR